MKILITGGAGFIGSHLAEAMVAAGNEVTAIDDLSTGAQANIEPLLSNPRFQFVRGSVCDPSLLTVLVERCDLIFHLAAAVGVQLSARSTRSRPIFTVPKWSSSSPMPSGRK